MSTPNALEKQVHAALEVEPRVNLHRYPVRIEATGPVVTLSGTVEHIAAKRRAVRAAQSVDGVEQVIDHLLLEVAEPMGQDQILQHVRDALYEEPALCNYRLLAVNKKNETETVHDPDGAAGEIRISVDAEGRVSLAGEVGSLSHRRLAEVLAWWVPASTDVNNSLEVVPPEQDNDGEILDAVELVLEKDRLINIADLSLGCKDAVVVLAGGIPTGKQKMLAECDAWYVNGVQDVDNRLIPVDPA